MHADGYPCFEGFNLDYSQSCQDIKTCSSCGGEGEECCVAGVACRGGRVCSGRPGGPGPGSCVDACGGVDEEPCAGATDSEMISGASLFCAQGKRVYLAT